MALKAIDNYRKVVESNPELLTQSELKPLRQRLLDAPVAFYRDLKQSLLREMSESSLSTNLEQKLILANFSLAWLNAESGAPVDALKAYQEAAEIVEPVVNRGSNSQLYRSYLATVLNNMGNIQVDLGRFQEARTTHEKALALREGAVKEQPDNVELLFDLSYSEHNLGWVDSKVGRIDSALDHYRRAARLREQVLLKYPTDPGRRAELATTLQNLGWIVASTGSKKEARDIYRRGVAILEECALAQPNVVSYRSSLADILRGLAEVLEGNDARVAFSKSAALLEAIVAEAPTIHRFRSNLAATLRLAGNLESNSKEYGRAIALEEKALRLGEALAREHPEIVQYQLELANSLMNLGLTLNDAGRPTEALALHERAVAVFEAIVRDNPADIATASLVAGAYNNAGLALEKLGRHEEATLAFREAINRERACLERDPKTAQYRSWMSNHYMNLGKSLRALGRKDEALAMSRARFELLSAAPPEQRDVGIHYHVTCEMAQTAAMIGRGKPDAELTDLECAERKKYADRAVDEFRLALADGFSDLSLFVHDEDLDPIRDRPDFQRLLASAMDRGFPAEPFAREIKQGR